MGIYSEFIHKNIQAVDSFLTSQRVSIMSSIGFNIQSIPIRGYIVDDHSSQTIGNHLQTDSRFIGHSFSQFRIELLQGE